MKLAKDLREFIELLNSHGVEYLVVGGHAVAYHGYPRYTGDIDLFIRATAENAVLVLRVLNAFGFGDAGIEQEDLTASGRIIQLGTPPQRIDLVTEISGVSFEQAWTGRLEALLDGLPVYIIGRRELLQNKRAAGRAKDLADVEAIDPEER